MSDPSEDYCYSAVPPSSTQSEIYYYVFYFIHCIGPGDTQYEGTTSPHPSYDQEQGQLYVHAKVI